jgi:hypothetical protein
MGRLFLGLVEASQGSQRRLRHAKRFGGAVRVPASEVRACRRFGRSDDPFASEALRSVVSTDVLSVGGSKGRRDGTPRNNAANARTSEMRLHSAPPTSQTNASRGTLPALTPSIMR